MHWSIKVILASFVLLTCMSLFVRPIAFRSQEQAHTDREEGDDKISTFLPYLTRFMGPLIEGARERDVWSN